MKKNTKTVLLWVIAAVVLLALVLIARDLYLSSPGTVECEDGERGRIDIRDFVVQYSGYSVQFEADLGEKGRFSGNLDPVVLRQLSDSAQSGAEFRKFLVAGYNSCAISKAQYAQFGSRYQALDGLARRIDRLAEQTDPTEADRKALTDLVGQYVESSERLALE